MRRAKCSVHHGYAADKQAAQRYAEEVYFQSQPNQGMPAKKLNDHLFSSEELEYAEMEAACIQVEFPIVNVLIRNFSPAAKHLLITWLRSSSSKQVFSPPPPSISTAVCK
ncbi:unnamed protein product [Schistosoma mattheei]|uniref:Uncharacterized protein n=1 Tax=Schistosoma mattheei TaxID=31246 RepID=A0A183P6U5_9TREM|nr:unnamed protein product [Schistosoma mattheei]